MRRPSGKKKSRNYIEAANPLAPRPARSPASDPFKRRPVAGVVEVEEPYVHVYGKHVICDTEARGYPTPGNRSPTEIVLDASNGFIPLWAKDTTLLWRFQDRSLSFFEDVSAAKTEISTLVGEAILAWGDAAPVKFVRSETRWDFEIKIRSKEDCDPRGCVLASAFFPDAGRHELEIYPTMFQQDRSEQINTLVHEIGHVFGLRHFFANISELDSPSVIFGNHRPISIMNYGAQSKLTSDDRADLKRLYQLVWSGQLSEINGTPIRLVRPFSAVNSA